MLLPVPNVQIKISIHLKVTYHKHEPVSGFLSIICIPNLSLIPPGMKKSLSSPSFAFSFFRKCLLQTGGLEFCLSVTSPTDSTLPLRLVAPPLETFCDTRQKFQKLRHVYPLANVPLRTTAKWRLSPEAVALFVAALSAGAGQEVLHGGGWGRSVIMRCKTQGNDAAKDLQSFQCGWLYVPALEGLEIKYRELKIGIK